MMGCLHGRNKASVKWVIFYYGLKDSEAYKHLWYLPKKKKSQQKAKEIFILMIEAQWKPEGNPPIDLKGFWIRPLVSY